MGKLIRVSDDIDVRWDRKCLVINSVETNVIGCVNVKPAELAPLLAALTGAAEVMGVSTVQAELVALLKETEWRMGACFWCGHSKQDGHTPDCKLGQAIAKAEQ